MLVTVVSKFVFNILPKAKVIWRQGHCLGSHPPDWRSRGSNSRPQGTSRGVEIAKVYTSVLLRDKLIAIRYLSIERFTCPILKNR